MKKIVSLLIAVFVVLTLSAQPPHPGQRPLPNQFRDFVDHQQRLDMNRPKIEKKDGKVIITMSEEQFKRMRDIRMSQRFKFANLRHKPQCEKCVKIHRRHVRYNRHVKKH
jgi:hypothetical protein